MKIPHDYIISILNGHIVINCASKDKEKLLKNLGAYKQFFKRSKWTLEFTIGSKLELATKLEKLRDAGFCFAGGPAGWPPSAVFLMLREQGIVSRKIIELMWNMSGQAVKREI